MALGLGPDDLEGDAGGQLGQAPLLGGRVGAGLRLVVAALLVGGEEALEGDDRAGGAELDRWAPSTAVSTESLTVAVEPRASAICEATVRFQISS